MILNTNQSLAGCDQATGRYFEHTLDTEPPILLFQNAVDLAQIAIPLEA
jgi:hypothetical protein